MSMKSSLPRYTMPLLVSVAGYGSLMPQNCYGSKIFNIWKRPLLASYWRDIVFLTLYRVYIRHRRLGVFPVIKRYKRYGKTNSSIAAGTLAPLVGLTHMAMASSRSPCVRHSLTGRLLPSLRAVGSSRTLILRANILNRV